MISALGGLGVLLVVLVFGLFAGIAMGMEFVEGNLLKEGFRIDRFPLRDIGYGRYELYRRNTEGKWVRIKNVE
jgi:hypothetical protein